MHEWFKTWYGPSNCVLSIAGDISTDSALAKVKHYFGDIPPGPPIPHQQVWIAKRTGTHRQTVEDRAPQAWSGLSWATAQESKKG